MAERRTNKQTSDAERELSAQMDQLQKDLAKLTDSLKALGAQEAGKLSDDLKEKAANLVAQGRQYVEDATGSADRIEAELARSVRDKPLQSLAIAAALGLVLGLLTRRG